MSDLRRIEVTTRYATNVESLAEAWAFVMDHVDRVGPDPMVMIKPTWYYAMAPDEGVDDGDRWFSVVVNDPPLPPQPKPQFTPEDFA